MPLNVYQNKETWKYMSYFKGFLNYELSKQK